jgi:transketolase
MVSQELFDEQDESYRSAVLPNTHTARVVIEAGIRMGWDRYAGPHGAYVTMETFGASAPAPELFRRFGFTVERVVEAAEQSLRSLEGFQQSSASGN